MGEQRPPGNLLRYATAGLEFFLTFLVFLAAGWLVDRQVGWRDRPFTILGGIVGFAVGFWRIARQGWGILRSGEFGGEEDRREEKDHDRE